MKNKLPLNEIRWVEFQEHPIALLRKPKVALFEITSSYLKNVAPFNHERYCELLIEKVLLLHRSLIPKFLDYQCGKVKYPIRWLTKLENLMELNARKIIELGFGQALNNLFFALDEIRYYFHQIKNASLSIPTLPPIKESKLDSDNYEHLDLPKNSIQNKDELPIVPWHGQVNVLVDIFYQLMNLIGEDGKPLIRISKNLMAEHLVLLYRKSDGTPLTKSTVLTILTPSRSDKRPNHDKQIDISEILKKYDKKSE